MNFWPILIGVAVVMLVIGSAIQAATALVWTGVIVLIVSVIMTALESTDVDR
ncbi:hypothetical protein GCM10023169_41820 [Georgenia halophila]|uniref:Uncharacterized protein n=1 Tax=Georgenia halophila TaxID=620889 RepID=A0ABP8LTC4_9MICO